MTNLTPKPTNSLVTFNHHIGKLWTDNKKNIKHPKTEAKIGLASGGIATENLLYNKNLSEDLKSTEKPPTAP